MQNRKSILKYSVAFLSIGMLLGVIISQAVNPSSTFFISPGVYPGAPSYTVWAEGSTYYAKNAYGMIDASDASFNDLINSLSTAFYDANEGGTIQLEKGEYFIDGRIYLKPGTALIGEPPIINPFLNTIESGTQITSQQSGATQAMIFISDTMNNTNIIVENIALNGNNKADWGLQFYNIFNCRFENLKISGIKEGGIGIDIQITPTGPHCVENIFRHITMSFANKVKGIKLYGYSNNGAVTHNLFEDIRISGFYPYALEFAQYSDSNVLIKIHVDDPRAGAKAGIILNSEDPTNDNGVMNNAFYSYHAEWSNSSIYQAIVNKGKSSQSHVFVALSIQLNSTPFLIQNGGLVIIQSEPAGMEQHGVVVDHPDTTDWGIGEKGRRWWCSTHEMWEWWNGVKIKGEKYWLETSVSDGAQIAHGLWAEPITVLLTPQGLNPDVLWSYQTDATYVTIQHDSVSPVTFSIYVAI